MNNPSLYILYNAMVKRDAPKFLRQCTQKMTWSKDDVIMDAGCGSGDITTDVLLPHCPTFAKMVAVDKSAEMIAFAKENYSHEKISYRIMDLVATKQPRTIFPEGFSKIFSLFCLHWIEKQSLAVNNFYQLLNPGGDCLLIFFAYGAMFDVYERLIHNKRWAQYMTDFQKFLPVHQKSSEPEKEFRQTLEECGFNVIECVAPDLRFPYESYDYFRNLRRAVDPFFQRMPKDLQEEYLDAYFNDIISNPANMINGKIATPYKLIFAFAKKPS